MIGVPDAKDEAEQRSGTAGYLLREGLTKPNQRPCPVGLMSCYKQMPGAALTLGETLRNQTSLTLGYPMKNMKSMAVGFATILIAALCIGASSGGEQRPSEVPSERWISIGDRAGFAVNSSKGSQTVGAELYLKTEQGWRRARVENPAHVYPVTP